MMKKLLIHTSKYTMKFLVRIIIISTFFLFSCDEISEIGINEILTDQQNKIKVEFVKFLWKLQTSTMIVLEQMTENFCLENITILFLEKQKQ